MSVQNFSLLACLEVAEKFFVVVGWGGFQVATISNLRVGHNFIFCRGGYDC